MKIKRILFTALIITVVVVIIAIFWSRKASVDYLDKAIKETNPQTKIELLTKAVSINKNLEDAYLERAKTYLKLAGDYMDIFRFVYGGGYTKKINEDYIEKAYTDLQKVTKSEKYTELGKINLIRQDYNLALENLGKPPKSALNIFETRLFTAFAYVGLKNYRQSLEILQGLLDSSPDKSKIYSMIANLHSRIQDNKLALENYRKALDSEITDTGLLYSLSYDFLVKKDWDYAKKAIDKLSTTNMQPSSYILYALYYWNKDKDKSKTMDYLQKAKDAGAIETKDLRMFPIGLLEGLQSDPDLQKYLPENY